MKITLVKPDNVTTSEVEFESMEELSALILKSAWCPGTFKNGYRNKNNFLRADVIALDFDDGMTLQEAMDVFASYKHIIATTKSHGKEKNGKVADRFRVVLKLKHPIINQESYTATYLELKKSYPTDPACKDASRQFYPSVEIVSGAEEGEEIDPIVLRSLSNSTREFLENSAPKGEWNNGLVKAVRNMQQQGYTKDVAKEMLFHSEGYLDQAAERSIESLYNSEPQHEVRLVREAPSMPEYVLLYLHHHGFKMGYDGMVYKQGHPFPLDTLKDLIKVSAFKEKVRGNTEILTSQLNLWVNNSMKAIVTKHKNDVRFDDTAKFDWEKFLTLLTGQFKPLDKYVLQHFVWQVKRKLHELPVVWHVMPILVGPSGGGKSTVINRFISVLGDLSVKKTFSALSDERELAFLGKYYIAFFDELAGSTDKMSVETIKKYITSDKVTYRQLGSHHQNTLPNKTTFIAAANNDVSEMIYDPTSARRYYQLNCVKIPKSNYPEIDTLNFIDAWKEIDELQDSPIIPHLEELQKAQESIRAKSSVEDWLEFRTMPSVEGKLSPMEAYEDYASFIKMQGKKQYSQRRFLSELSKLVDKVLINGYPKYRLELKIGDGTFKPGSPI